jgi:hypothetical protein
MNAGVDEPETPADRHVRVMSNATGILASDAAGMQGVRME